MDFKTYSLSIATGILSDEGNNRGYQWVPKPCRSNQDVINFIWSLLSKRWWTRDGFREWVWQQQVE